MSQSTIVPIPFVFGMLLLFNFLTNCCCANLPVVMCAILSSKCSTNPSSSYCCSEIARYIKSDEDDEHALVSQKEIGRQLKQFEKSGEKASSLLKPTMIYTYIHKDNHIEPTVSTFECVCFVCFVHPITCGCAGMIS